MNYSQKGAGAPRELFIFSKNGVGAVFRAGCFSGFVLNMAHLPGCALKANRCHELKCQPPNGRKLLSCVCKHS